ncbi:MAG: molecular chaperone TorD family protein [Acidimicrobiales bacterium]
MFVYSLSGLALASDSSGEPVEVEENETTARSAVYQWLGKIFGTPEMDHFERAGDGRWAKELQVAAAGLPYPFDVPHVDTPSDIDPSSYKRAFATLASSLDERAANRGSAGDRERDLEEIRRAYEYFGLAAMDNGLRPDHLVSKCDYLQYLTFKEAATSSVRLRRSYRRAELEFLDRHLASTSSFAAQIKATGTISFVDWATQILVSFLGADTAYIRELVGS